MKAKNKIIQGAVDYKNIVSETGEKEEEIDLSEIPDLI